MCPGEIWMFKGISKKDYDLANLNNRFTIELLEYKGKDIWLVRQRPSLEIIKKTNWKQFLHVHKLAGDHIYNNFILLTGPDKELIRGLR